MIESLEGKRGHPRIKPPYPAEIGLFGKPTAVNNVETLANIPAIIKNGAEWYKTIGTETCPGTKIFTISGDINNPGYYECPMGTPLDFVINTLAGGVSGNGELKAVLLGGAAGTFLPPQYLNLELCYDNLKKRGFTLGSGAIIILNSTKKVSSTLRDILRFFKHESCGKCTPCRAGTTQLLEIMDIASGNNCRDLEACFDKMVDLSDLMFKTSLYALGQSPKLPLQSAWKH